MENQNQQPQNVQNGPKPCLFCAIAEGKIESKKVYEDSNCIAFLDIRPRAKGMTIIMPKKHYKELGDSPSESMKVFQAAETVSEMIKNSLEPKQIDLSIIGSEEVPHFHIRLYPIYGEEKPLMESVPSAMSEENLNLIAEKIKSANTTPFVEEKIDEKERSEEEVENIRKSIEEA